MSEADGRLGESISVRKRNGQIERLNLDKVHKMVERSCEGLSGVSVSDVEMHAKLSFYDGITTTEIHRALTKAAADLISEGATNYQYVAGRLLNDDIRKSAWGGNTPPRLFAHIQKMIETGYYSPELLKYYTEEEWDKLDSYIDHDRDYNMAHIGISEYLTKYAVRDRSRNDVFPLETPQITYMLIAAVLFAEDKSLKAVKSYYNDISSHVISLPTPIMAGIRTPTKQGSSCILLAVDDTLDSIISGAGVVVKYISKKAGLGIDVSRIRAEGSSVGREKGVKHTGMIPFLRLFESAVKSCSQGGVRGGSATTFYSLWHLEIEELLVLKNNKGTQDNRVRKMDYGVQINNYLYNRFVQNKDITLFSPHEATDLYDAFFSDQKKFADLYEQYEENPNIRKKRINARELFTKLMIERKETGRIYIFNVDNANIHSSFKVPITQSNLCLSGDTRIATDKGLLTLRQLHQEQTEFTVSSDNRAFEGREVLPKFKNGKLANPESFGTTICDASRVFLTQRNAEIFNLTLQNGMNLKATPDHKIMTTSGMKRLGDLAIGDLVYIQSGEGTFTSEEASIPSSPATEPVGAVWTTRYGNNEFLPPVKWSRQLGELLGWTVGDGFISKTEKGKLLCLVFGKNDRGLLEYFDTYVKSMFAQPTSRLQEFEGSTQLRFVNKRLVGWLESLGVSYKKAHEKTVPDSIWQASREAQIGFLRGIFTSDGTVDISKHCQAVTVSLGSTSIALLQGVQLLLSNFGIKSSIYKQKHRGFSMLPDSKRVLKPYPTQQFYVMKIGKSNRNRFLETIGFMLGRKNDKVTKTIDTLQSREFVRVSRNSTYIERFAVKVAAIDPAGREDVYDITVKDSHSFIANGIVVHNCMEITLPTTPLQSLDDPNGEVATCSLSAVNLGNIKSFDDLASICRNAVRGLDNMLSYQDYMVPAARNSTMKYRPLGIGIINLAYYLAKNGVKYGDPAAHKLIHDTMEAIQYYCIKASIELAKEKGACIGLADTKYGDGLLPIDHYNKNVDEIAPPKYNLNWEWLRGELKKYGIRNATLTALMPAESSAKISNATNGVEPVRSLITTKSNKNNVSRQVVPEYSRLKNKYDLLWDMKSNEGVIKCMAVIQKFVDQSISTNNNYNPMNYPNNEIPMSVLLKDLLLCNKFGLKSLYYCNSNDQRDTEVTDKPAATEPAQHAEEVCDSCTI